MEKRPGLEIGVLPAVRVPCDGLVLSRDCAGDVDIPE